MRICILSITDMSRMTMVKTYTDYFDSKGYSYDFIYVSRYGEKKQYSADNYYTFDTSAYTESSFPVKLYHYWEMRPFAEKIFKENRYDMAVVWGELSAFIFSDLLKKYFKGKYCLNVRDYFYNTVPVVKGRMRRAVLNSLLTTVSSGGYLDYLPKSDRYLILHSFNSGLISDVTPRTSPRAEGEPIRILYLGLIARLEYVYKIIDELGNDGRYELYFTGIGSEDVDKYIEGKNLKNVFTHGPFDQNETGKFLEGADIIYNLYGHNNRHFDLALSIKLYYALWMNVPIMAFKGTYTSEVAKSCGLSFEVDSDDFSGTGDRLYKWYHGVDFGATYAKSREFLEEALKSKNTLYEKLDGFFKKVQA